jgi:bla regulator protein blaR1
MPCPQIPRDNGTFTHRELNTIEEDIHMTNICTKLLLIALTIAPLARPQQFEVASIKPADPNTHGMRVQMAPGGRLTASGVTVKFLIQQAYNVKDFQITGGPGWIGSDRYDISTKAEGEGQITPEQLRPMMQALLADRFKLTFHRETKEMPVYALVVGKNGPKMHESERHEDAEGRGGTQIRMSRGQITAQAMSMAMLANQLSNRLGRNVLDKTGLTGNYDFTLEFTPEGMQPMGMPPREGGADAPPPVDSPGPSIFTAVQDQLGLKLESQKGPVEILILDRIERPSEN